MKTAILKTDIWKDNLMYLLNIDTKLLYLFLATSPDRNTTRFYRCPDRLISAYVGLSDKALDICKQQLQEKGLVFFVDGWIVLGDFSYVKPSTGKLSQVIYQQDVDNVPVHIKQFALENDLDFELSTEKSSGVALEYKDKDNNNITPIKNLETLGVEYKQTSDVWEENEDGSVSFKR